MKRGVEDVAPYNYVDNGSDLNEKYLYIKVFRISCVLLDELTSGLDGVAHEEREHSVARHCVLHRYTEKRSSLGVHRGFPELLGVHLTKTLISVGTDISSAAELFDANVPFLVGECVKLLALTALAVDLIKRRLCKVHVSVLDELSHVTEE